MLEYYASLDRKEAHFQIEHDGCSLCRFQRLPFGLSCAPAISNRKLQEILAPPIREEWVRNYLDDVILWERFFVHY